MKLGPNQKIYWARDHYPLWDDIISWNITDWWVLTSSLNIKTFFLYSKTPLRWHQQLQYHWWVHADIIFRYPKKIWYSQTWLRYPQTKNLLKFDNLVLPSPAWPYWRKSGLNPCFWTIISSQSSKRPCYVRSYHQCILLRISLNLSWISKMGPLPIIFIKLSSYKDSDVGNIRKSNFLTIILDTRVRCEIRFN